MNDDLFQLGERIVELAARINIATCEMLTLIAEFDRREGWADEFTSCAEWIAVTTGRTLGTARENVRVAHALEDLPLTSREMSLGKISYTKVRNMTRVATPETEEDLLEYARAGSAAKLEQIVRGWKHLSRDGELTAEEARHQSRAFSVVIDGDGMYVMRGRLEPEVGAVLMRAIEAASDALYRDEHPDARPRSRQRRADAAGLVAERALAAGFGGESGTRAERFQVAVHTEMATLEKDGEPGRSEVDGVRVSAESSRRMACDAAVVPMTHRDGEVMGVGRKTRTIPPHIRRALEERDRGCRYPGCGSRFTEAHHVTHWADGGETSLANTVLLCRRHHRVVHEGRTRMALNRMGQAVFFAKKGKMIASAPPMVRPGQLTATTATRSAATPRRAVQRGGTACGLGDPMGAGGGCAEAVEEALEGRGAGSVLDGEGAGSALDGDGAGPAPKGEGGDVPSDVSAAKPGTPAFRDGTW